MSEGCDNCDGRDGGGPGANGFTYGKYLLCTECAAALASWLLDGGWRDAPELFGWMEGHGLPLTSPAAGERESDRG